MQMKISCRKVLFLESLIAYRMLGTFIVFLSFLIYSSRISLLFLLFIQYVIKTEAENVWVPPEAFWAT